MIRGWCHCGDSWEAGVHSVVCCRRIFPEKKKDDSLPKVWFVPDSPIRAPIIELYPMGLDPLERLMVIDAMKSAERYPPTHLTDDLISTPYDKEK